MSTPEQSETPQLTRKQMREQQRETGAVPITSVPAPAAGPRPVAVPPVPPLPRPAEPAAVPPAPVPDASVDLGVSPLTRRQARQQERIRTASVPVITPEVAAAHNAATAPAAPVAGSAAPIPVPAPVATPPAFDHALTAPAPRPSEPEPLTAASSLRSLFETTGETAGETAGSSSAAPTPAPVAPTPLPAVPPAAQRDEFADALASLNSGSTPVQNDRPKVNSAFGASLQSGGAADPSTQSRDSFDGVLSRDTSTNGSVASPHTLIVSQNPTAGPISAPIASTGEVLVTGTYALPDGLGSMGHVPGAADGKEVDATLVDGELPVHSSPTPIAASAAISTAKGQDELIRPPAPEKNSKLMLTLAITAGALALALVGVLVVAFATGVFNS